MALRPALVYQNNPGSVPAEYVIPPGFDLAISSVTAELDGASASGTFLACLSLYSQDNKLIGRWFPSTLFLVGDSGEVTWSEFLGEEAIALVLSLGVELSDLSTAVSSGSWTTVFWDTEVYDPSGYHSPTVNPSRVTIPAGLGGYYLVLGRTINDEIGSNSYQGCRVRLNGSSILDTHENYGSPTYVGISSLVWTVESLAAGDYVEIQAIQDTGSPKDFSSRISAIGIAPIALCQARLGAAVSIATATWTTVDLTDDIDPDGMHDNGTNPSRITAPTSGVYLVMAGGGFVPANGGTRGCRVLANGSVVAGSEQHLIGSVGGTEQGIIAYALVELAAGDYVEMQAYQSSGAALNLASARLFAAYVGATDSGYAAGVGSTAISAVAWTDVDLAAEQVDTGGWHSDTTAPARFTCQTEGAYLVLLNALSLTPQLVQGARPTVNGAAVGSNSLSRGTDTQPISAQNASLLSLAAGDYVTLQAYVGDLAETLDRTRCALGFLRVGETIV